MRLRPARLAPLPLLLLALDASPRAHARQAPACTLVGADSLTSVPGRPFQALPSADGCHLFVSLNPAAPGQVAGVAVLAVTGGALRLQRVVPTPQPPAGMALSRDGTVLVATHDAGASLFRVDALVRGDEALIGRIPDKPGAGRVYAATSPDDALLLLADERARSITVVDFAKARTPGGMAASVLGAIPTGDLPIALTFSPDGRWLFTTSQRVPDTRSWPVVCRKLGSLDPADPPAQVEGAVLVVDVALARTDPARSVVRTVRAGCNPVRLVLSPDGSRAYVSARAENALLVFDARALAGQGDTTATLVARIPVGTAPVGIAVTPDGRRVLVTNSNRFAFDANDRQSVSVIDAARVGEGAAAKVGEIPAGAFPRELRLHPDGRTVVLTNFASQTVQLVDLARLP